MIEIPLQAIPNQKFSVQLDNRLYDITITATGNVMSCTLVRDGETIQDTMRLVAGTPLLPYLYQEAGNFALITASGDLPDYTQFGVTQFLLYASQDELDAIRG
jgi:hypothetical protein